MSFFFFLPVVPIQFTKPLMDVKVARLGEPATFLCEVTKPDARAQWLKDGFDLTHGPKYDIGVTGRNYRLTVKDVDDRDAGDYAVVVGGLFEELFVMRYKTVLALFKGISYWIYFVFECFY